jgi:hypothetical protein
MKGIRGDLFPTSIAAPVLGLLFGTSCGGGGPAETLREELAVLGPGDLFDPASVAGLPEPARRYLLRSIAPGTPLSRSVQLEMSGEIRLEPDGDPLAIVADQILAPPLGFVWNAQAGRGIMRIQGFDRYGSGAGEMRWRFWGTIPVMSARGADVTRSAAGRLAMEAVLLPSSLVPGRGATWEGVDDRSARFRMRVGEESVESTLEVDADGRPVRVSAMRWSEDAGPGYDLFVVEFRGELEVDGYRIPRELTAGWRLGAEDEFRFYRATLQRARFQ